jgi:erythronate-4-phosphate dehydrogenase
MLKIIADDKIPFLRGALEKVAFVEYYPGGKITRKLLDDADALITRTRTKCNKDLLNDTAVKLITSATIGFDHIDTQWCDTNGIQWTNAPGCNSGSVKQYIASALAYIVRKERKSFNDITLGIVGVGNVGYKVQQMAERLGIRVLKNDPPRQRKGGSNNFTQLEELIKQADIITMHVPLNKTGEDKTFHLADKSFFASMKKGAWFINSSRGEVVQTHALKQALQSNHLAGAIIDVWENEPHIDEELTILTDIATPHIAGYSADGKANGTAMSVQAISRHFNLGLDNWYPDNIPAAPNPMLELSCRGKSMEEIFAEISMFAYDIEEDSRLLKSSLATFEEQRGSYPVRREPEVLKVKLLDDNENCKKIFAGLGYECLY